MGHDSSLGPHDKPKQSMRATFITVFLILGFLTIVEVFVPQVYDGEYNRTMKGLLLTILAFAKAFLVASYFMHLKWEKPWLKWIAAMPLYMGIAVIVLMLETVFRGPHNIQAGL